MQESLHRLKRVWLALWRRSGRWILRRKWLLGGGTLALTIWLLSLPAQLFDAPYSSVLLDRDGQLLGARIAADGQWRFPVSDSVPETFTKAITTFEDKRFFSHPGVDPLALGRALWLNVTHKEILSGGSTLSMQVIRLSRPGKPRSLVQKFIEIWLATRLELSHSKEEILALYAAHAPFGGNVVGLETAAWRYFSRPAGQLSWAEAATLAVLPNAPGLIHPGRNRDALRLKRDRLLNMMLEAEVVDSMEYDLALLEALPEKPHPIPNLAPHLLARCQLAGQTSDDPVWSTIQLDLQKRANELVALHHRRLSANGIHNAALLVAEIESGSVIAYVGNTEGSDPNEGHAVDIITAPRSTGSILKPFLYAAMLHEGEMLPRTLITDVPSYYGSFSPTNYDQQCHGAVPADEALARSLNIPAVRMLHKHGIHRFQQELIALGLTTLFRSSEDYGLSLILGGAEASLWDLTGAYTGMARILRHYSSYNGRYDPDPFSPLTYIHREQRAQLRDEDWDQMRESASLSAGSVWHTFQAMKELKRPGEDAGWRNFSSSASVAWKTGTSYGFRDAWAIGVIPGYVVGVWVGNADGEGRPGLVGTEAAAPILFDMISALDRESEAFRMPYDDLVQVPVCEESGHLAGEYCTAVDSVFVPARGMQTDRCPYHQIIWTTEDGRHRVHSDCESRHRMFADSLFVLSPQQEVYFRIDHPWYRPIPPWRSDCQQRMTGEVGPLALSYPIPNASVFLPTELDGAPGKLVLEAAHSRSGSAIFWHLDETYLGFSQDIHQMVVRPGPGDHTLTLVDEEGNQVIRRFRVLSVEAGPE